MGKAGQQAGQGRRPGQVAHDAIKDQQGDQQNAMAWRCAGSRSAPRQFHQDSPHSDGEKQKLNDTNSKRRAESRLINQ